MTAHVKQGSTFNPPLNAIVWFEIPVSNLAAAKKFYSSVLLNELNDMAMGPNMTAVFARSQDETGVSGHLYEGKPASSGSGPTIHLPLPDSLEAGLERVIRAGGTVLSGAIEIPAGRFAYCLDPDGNSIGLFSR
ncbi:MAG: VOC family protein [Rhizobiaceae bacterium]